MTTNNQGELMKNTKIHGIGLANLFILLTILMMISYIHLGERSEKIPFNMSSNSIKLTSENLVNVPVSLINKYNNVADITIISTYDEAGTIGIYDPSMNYAMGNTVVLFGQTRYFSPDDYKNGTKSGIIVSNNLAYDLERCKNFYTDFIEDVLYCTDQQVMLSNNGKTREIINLFSFDVLGESVYLDYYNESGKKVVNNIVKELEDYGYYVNTDDIPGVVESLLQPNRDLISVIMTGSLLFYILYYIVSYWYFFNIRRKISIHHLHGGQYISTGIHFITPLLFSTLLQMIPVFLFARYQRNFGYLIMSDLELLFICILHIIVTLCIHFIAYHYVFKSIINKRGDYDYVG